MGTINRKPGSGSGGTPASVGLGNVTNDAQLKAADKGVANGVASLDATGKVPAGQLPASAPVPALPDWNTITRGNGVAYGEGGTYRAFSAAGSDASLALSRESAYTYVFSGEGCVYSGRFGVLCGAWPDRSDNPIPAAGALGDPKVWVEFNTNAGSGLNILANYPGGATVIGAVPGYQLGQRAAFSMTRTAAQYAVSVTYAGATTNATVSESALKSPMGRGPDLVGIGKAATDAGYSGSILFSPVMTRTAYEQMNGPAPLGAAAQLRSADQSRDRRIQFAYKSLDRSARAATGSFTRPWFNVSSDTTYNGIYLWDEYFIAVAALHYGTEATALARGSFLNVLDRQQSGRIPRAVRPDNTEEGAGNESAPWAAQLAVLLTRGDGLTTWLGAAGYAAVKAAVLWWDSNRKTGRGLFQWRNRPESGVDTATSLGNPNTAGYNDYTLQFESAMCSSLMAREWLALALLADVFAPSEAAAYRANAQAVTDAINTYLWDETDGWYYNYDVTTSSLLKIKHQENGLLPVWAGVATPARTTRVLDQLIRADWLGPRGLQSIGTTQPGYLDGPTAGLGLNINGPAWMPGTYLAAWAFRRAGRTQDALNIAQTMDTAFDAITRQSSTFSMSEHWSALTATPYNAADFAGWGNAGVFLQDEWLTGVDPHALTLTALQ